MKLKTVTQQDCNKILEYIHKLAEHEGVPEAVEMTSDMLATALFEERVIEAFLIEYQADIVGLVVVSKNFSTYRGKTTLFLEDLYLDSTARGLGLGKKVLVALQQLAQERGYGRIEWTCLNDNQGAKAFYERQGAQALTDKTIYRLAVE